MSKKKKDGQAKKKSIVAICIIILSLVGVLGVTAVKNEWARRAYRQAENALNGNVKIAGAVYVGNVAWGKFDGEGTLSYDAGVTVEGTWQNGSLQGIGSADYNSVGIYKGEFDNSVRSGEGTFTWVNGDKYTGHWCNDTMEGLGVYEWVNGDVYTGYFKDGSAYGEGELVFSTGESYRGEFILGKYSGKGTFTYPGIGCYSGEFIDSKRNGEGTFYWENGIKYEGLWRDDEYTGEGVLTYSNRDVVVGEFSDGKLFKGSFGAEDENATYTYEVSDGGITNVTVEYSDGSKYAGEILNGKNEGQGSFISHDGTVYEGIFTRGKFISGSVKQIENNNVCTLTVENSEIVHAEVLLIDGVKYIGDYSANGFTGKGSYYYPNGDSYSGDLVKGVRSGMGVYTWANGDVYEGEWSKDKINGDGTYYYKSTGKDYRLVGIFVSGVPKGECTFYESDSKSYITAWKDGKCTSYKVSTNSVSGEITLGDGAEAKAELIFSDGSTYSGEVKDGKISGVGTMTYNNKDTYTGDFSDGVKCGNGNYTWSNGAVYIGDWSNDVMSGKGTYYYPKGESGYMLVGSFSGGKPNGECEYYVSSTKHYKTTWKDGKCTKLTE